jgi:magnesium chelatase subunit D
MDAAAGFADAMLAMRLLLHDPVGLGGIVLRGDGPARDAVVATLPDGTRKLPRTIDDDRLIGGLDVAATLASERPVARQGLLADADGALIVVPMAERLSATIASRIGGVLDTGVVVVEREGLTARHAARIGLVLLDDGVGDECVFETLTERMAFRFDLDATRGDAVADSGGAADRCDKPLETLAAAALAFGIDSARAPIFALRAAYGLAALDGRAVLSDHDVATAARLVFASRATRLPPHPEEHASPPEPPPPSDPSDADTPDQIDPDTLDDVVIESVRAALPADVLAMIASGAGRGKASASGGAGERRKSPLRGRPLGSRAGSPRAGARLALIDTLRAAAPWQRIRGRTGRVVVKPSDIRIKRFEHRAEATTIFAVDASGSAAIARLGEAKGAVEILLAQAYVKRTQVALIAFRGTEAELILPPTRSLTRARRALGDLPGGGGTPLSAGINAARQLAEAVKAKGRTPFIVLLTDGRANIAADGTAVRAVAMADAAKAAQALATTGIKSVFIDTSPRPRDGAGDLAVSMAGRYLALPQAGAAAIGAAVQALQS